MAQVRQHSYTRFAWPGALGRLYQHAGLTVAWRWLPAWRCSCCYCRHWPHREQRQFLRLLPAPPAGGLFGPVFGFAVLALGMGCGASGVTSARKRRMYRQCWMPDMQWPR
jgi:citrate/tricarballylate utilization protein